MTETKWVWCLKGVRAKHLRVLSFALFGLTACGSATSPDFPVHNRAQKLTAEEQHLQIVPVNVENIRKVISKDVETKKILKKAGAVIPKRDYVYRVGPGDVLKVTLWDNPERIAPAGVAAPDLIVSEGGSIFYPYVGELSVAGKSTSEIRRELITALGSYLQAPQVEVSVAGYNSHTVTLIGQVGAPGKYPITNVPLSLLDALNKAGRSESSDLTEVIIRRNGTDYCVDLNAFIETGQALQNPVLMPEDIVIVAKQANEKVYTFGEIGVGELKLNAEDASLTSIIAKSGGIDKLRANARGVFVFRGSSLLNQDLADSVPDVTVYQFELDQPAMYVLAQSFTMRDGDVIFVTQEPISRWNDLVAKLLSPVITTIRAKAVTTALSGG